MSKDLMTTSEQITRFSDKGLVLKAHECDVESLFSLNKIMVGVAKGNLGLGKGTSMLRVNSYCKSNIELSKLNMIHFKMNKKKTFEKPKTLFCVNISLKMSYKRT